MKNISIFLISILLIFLVSCADDEKRECEKNEDCAEGLECNIDEGICVTPLDSDIFNSTDTENDSDNIGTDAETPDNDEISHDSNDSEPDEDIEDLDEDIDEPEVFDPNADTDGDGIPNGVEGETVDTDGDGKPDYLDLDSDNDGISDKLEAGNNSSSPVDSDNDGKADYVDNDSDGDGIPDKVEGNGDPDEDGKPSYIDTDSDNDGLSDTEEAGNDPTNPLNSDNDSKPDYIDTDSDNDGIADSDESSYSTSPVKEDTDGDGFSDLAEITYGSDPTDPTSVIPDDVYYVVLPYGDPDAELRTLDFSTDIQKADIIISIDLSGSMSSKIENLKNDISSVIINGVNNKISDAAFGLSTFASWRDLPYALNQPITKNVTDVETAVDNLNYPKGGWYEPVEETLYQLASGAGLSGVTVTVDEQMYKKNTSGIYEEYSASWPYYSNNGGAANRDIEISAADCNSELGNIGGACFREDALPIFVLIADEPISGHDMEKEYFLSTSNGVTNLYSMDGRWVTGEGHTLDNAINAMNNINAKFLGIYSDDTSIVDSQGNSITQNPIEDFTYISEATGSVDDSNEPFIYEVATDGTGMSNNIVSGIEDLVNSIRLDVTTRTSSITNTQNIDTTQFIKALKPFNSDPSNGYQSKDNSTFFGVHPSTTVTFEISFQNTTYAPQTESAEVFKAKIDVMGEGTLLDSRDVFIIIPGSRSSIIEDGN